MAQPGITAPDWTELGLGLVAGLVVFLVGVEHMSHAFAQVGEGRLREWVARFTRSPLTGVITGAVLCTVLDSSSATIIMLIAMIRGGVLTFEQSLGVVLGANVGTTIGAQIIALDVFGYAPVFLLVGFVMHLLARSPRWTAVGTGLLGAGLLFFGLGHLQEAVSPLRDHRPFLDWLEGLGDTPVYGALAGALATFVVQSSSATVGMAIVMAKAQLISVASGVAIMLGAEIGTVSNTLLASVGRGREALRCALFHLGFNAGSVIVGLLLIGPLIQVSELLAPGGSDDGGHVARSIANAQVLFNVVGVAVVLPFVASIARLLLRLVPARVTPGGSHGVGAGAD